jgi:hypothetical protein
VATPVLAMYAPQLFQGIKAEVGVAVAPTERDKTTGVNPRLANALLNIRAGRTTDMYWSAVTMFVVIPVLNDVRSDPT